MKKILTRLLDINEALDIVSKKIGVISRKKKIPTWKSVGYVSAQRIRSPIDYPILNRAGLDGYAVKHTDTPGKLRVVLDADERKWEKKLKDGQAMPISTGEFLPENADTVVPLEVAKREEDYIVVGKFSPFTNVDRTGSLIKKGQVIVEKGSVITPFDVTGLIETGIASVSVYTRIKTNITVVGDVLVKPKKQYVRKLIKDERIETSSIILRWLLNAYTPWIKINKLQLLPSAPKKIGNEILKDIDSTDLNIIVGSVGPGKKDVCVDTLDMMGASTLFRGLALKGGRPTTVAMLEGKPVFWVPGQPISVFSVFLHFLYPALKVLGGVKHSYGLPIIMARLAQKYGGGMPRLLYVLLRKRGKTVHAYPMDRKLQKSSSTITMAIADGAAIVGKNIIEKGDWVPVFLLKEKTFM